MDESAMNGLGLKELNGSDAENQNQCVVSVEGYDTSLQTYYLKLILEKHFSSCGKITDVSIFTDEETGLLERLSVLGFDDSASKHDIKIKMCEHLYSCGEVTEVFVCGHGRINSECFAMVYIMGRDVPDRARKLGGGNIKVGFVCPAKGEGQTTFSHQFRGCDVYGCNNTKATVVPPQEGFKQFATLDQRRLLCTHPSKAEDQKRCTT